MKKKIGVVDICGLPFKVYLADEDGCPSLSGSYAACFPDKLTIYLSVALPRASRRLYLAHEILHGVWAHTGTNDVLKGSGVDAVEETFVRVWAAPLLAAMTSAAKLRL